MFFPTLALLFSVERDKKIQTMKTFNTSMIFIAAVFVFLGKS